jgi:hypothetical protein
MGIFLYLNSANLSNTLKDKYIAVHYLHVGYGPIFHAHSGATTIKA